MQLSYSGLNITLDIQSPDIATAEQFLSARAIERRKKYNIPINKLDLPVNPAYVDSLKKLGLQIYYTSKWLNGALVYTTDTNLVARIKDFAFVKAYDLHKHKKSDSISNKKLEIPQEPIYKFAQIVASDSNRYDYGYGLNQIQMLDGVKLHNEGYTGKGMLIAILDAGFYHVDRLPAFDSIRQNSQILGTKDFVDRDTNVYDADSHGMMVLSTIAANIPGEFVGTAPEADFYLIRTEDAGSENIIEEFNWVAGAEFADSIGADIIHSSLGYNLFDDTTVNHSYKDMNGDTAPSTIGADIAASKGMLITVSAGNEGDNNWHYITSPADADSIITVGAVNKYGAYAYFSSTGPTFDGRIKPNVVAQGLSSTVEGTDGNITTASGTSFSGPITAGMVACLWQAHPELNNIQIIKAIQNNSSQTSSPDSLLGYGIPDYYMAMLYPTYLNKLDKKEQIQIYPNPFTENFKIKVRGKRTRNNIKVEIYDLLGNKVAQKKLNMIKGSTLDFTGLNSLKSGMYIIRLQLGKETYSFKMLKQN